MISKIIVTMLLTLVINITKMFATPHYTYETGKSLKGAFVSVEGYGPEIIAESPNFKDIATAAPGQFITIFRFNEFPKNKEIVLSFSSIRSLFGIEGEKYEQLQSP